MQNNMQPCNHPTSKSSIILCCLIVHKTWGSQNSVTAQSDMESSTWDQPKPHSNRNLNLGLLLRKWQCLDGLCSPEYASL